MTDGYRISAEELPQDTVREMIDTYIRATTTAVRTRDLYPEPRQAVVGARMAAQVEAREDIHFGAWHGDTLVGFTMGNAERPGTLMQSMSIVDPAHRRQGLYRALLQALIGEAEKRGYHEVVSLHVATNNPIVIAKLRAGFLIVGTELGPEFGMLVRLCLPLDPIRRELLEVRAGGRIPEGPLLDALLKT